MTYKDQLKEGIRYRSFPEIEDGSGNIEGLDFSVWCASLPKFFWNSVDEIEEFPSGFLKPDPALVEKFGKLMSSYGPKVGLSWRSGNMSFDRGQAYLGLRPAHFLLRWLGDISDFYCLQYGWEREEADYLRKKAERKISTFDDVDLFNDIEANLAIIANLDCVIGPPTATQQLAISLGVKTEIIAAGSPWWIFGGSNNRLGYAKNCRIYVPEIDNFMAPIESIVDRFKSEYSAAEFRQERIFAS